MLRQSKHSKSFSHFSTGSPGAYRMDSWRETSCSVRTVKKYKAQEVTSEISNTNRDFKFLCVGRVSVISPFLISIPGAQTSHKWEVISYKIPMKNVEIYKHWRIWVGGSGRCAWCALYPITFWFSTCLLSPMKAHRVNAHNASFGEVFKNAPWVAFLVSYF